MSTLEQIGGVLGYVAFAGLAVVIFLTFQQARHVRRLREWAGRAPERAAAAAERGLTTDDDDEADVAEEPAGPGVLERLREASRPHLAELDRRSPFDPRIIAAGLAAVLLGIAIATSGFGVFGGDENGKRGGTTVERNGRGEAGAPAQPLVAVFNASGATPGQAGTPGLASKIGDSVKDAGYELGKITDADSLPISVVMYRDGADAEAATLADDLEPVLGSLETTEMTPEIADAAGRAPLAVVIGFDDAGV